MSARDELQKVIFGYFGPTLKINAYRTPEQQDRELAEAIHAAGYRKPRTITAIEELHDLGRNAAILAANGTVWVNDGDHAQPWASVVEDPQGGPVWTDGEDIHLPATVLHEAAA